ncbi:MAG: ATP-grasp domain-containing protein [Candidatus Bathyarchaeota archaeon]|nr:ATP-grasp domain-containing protein [Candidatus Bathyarchaeota archaeon]
MKITVYEHVSGGGYAQQPIPQNIICEGFAMLRSVVADFKAAGNEVTVLLDGRLSKLNPPLDAVYTVPIHYVQEIPRFLKSIAKVNDALYIIAPETGGILKSLVGLAEQTGKISLNSTSDAIDKVADKVKPYETLPKFVSIPKTQILNLNDDVDAIKKAIKNTLGYPVVLKPADGTSCSGLSLVTEEAHVLEALAKIKAVTKTERFIAQEYINGQAASVSLLCAGSRAVAVSLNKQNIKLSTPNADSAYEGGEMPFDHWLKQETFHAAVKVAEAFPGLRGYVGVDFVLSEHKLFLVDINPRLTTSYVGLRKVVGSNLAKHLLAAVLENDVPKDVASQRSACFSKVETPKPTPAQFMKAAQLSEVVSPPFPLTAAGNAHSCALVVGEGASLDKAQSRLEEAKRRLLNIMG